VSGNREDGGEIMRRAILTLALAAGMVLGGASVALAHPNDPGPAPFLRDSAVNPTGLTNAKGPTVTAEYFLPNGDSAGFITSNIGIAQGYFVHSPTCILHPALSHD